jgi:RNA polymerase sigma factor (sigma-70 family)
MELSEAPSPSAPDPPAVPPEIERFLAQAIPMAENVARHRGATPAAATEIAQNVLIDIWQEWSGNPQAFDVARPLATFVAPRVVRAMINLARASERRLERDGMYLYLHDRAASARMDTDETFSTQELWRVVGAVLASVPRASREVFFLVYQDHATYDEVARARGITEATARVHCHRALASLRAALAHNRTLLT